MRTWAPSSTRKGAKSSKKPPTLKNPNKLFREGTSGSKKTPQVHPTRRIFIGTIPIDISIAEIMMTSYLEEGTIA